MTRIFRICIYADIEIMGVSVSIRLNQDGIFKHVAGTVDSARARPIRQWRSRSRSGRSPARIEIVIGVDRAGGRRRLLLQMNEHWRIGRYHRAEISDLTCSQQHAVALTVGV